MTRTLEERIRLLAGQLIVLSNTFLSYAKQVEDIADDTAQHERRLMFVIEHVTDHPLYEMTSNQWCMSINGLTFLGATPIEVIDKAMAV